MLVSGMRPERAERRKQSNVLTYRWHVTEEIRVYAGSYQEPRRLVGIYIHVEKFQIEWFIPLYSIT